MGMDGVSGFARCEENYQNIANERGASDTNHIVRSQPVPNLEEEPGEVLFGYRRTIDANTLTHGN